MLTPGQRSWALSCLLALLCLFLFVGCTSGNQQTRKPTATKTPQKTAITQTGSPTVGSTPSATATPLVACEGKLPNVVVPDGSTLVGSVTTTGATVGCAYTVKEDLKTVDGFFKNIQPFNGVIVS